MADGSIGRLGVDALIADVLARHPIRFDLADDAVARTAAFRLRRQAVVERGWEGHAGDEDGVERDGFDEGAIVLVGRFEGQVVATGRLVLPPAPLPTEEECGLIVSPAGRVVDVGRMVVARSQRVWHRGAFVALLAALYGEMRRQGFEVATGMMARDVRTLARVLGLRLEVLGVDRLSHGELRAPVRFSARDDGATLEARWAGRGDS